jgi:hypothetical protein
MPWCPICEQEYQPEARRCVDCGAALVPEPPLPDVPDDPARPEELARSRDSRLLAKAVEYLATQAVPAEVVPVPGEPGVQAGFALVVNAGAWERAVAAIAPFLASPPDPDKPDLAALVPESLKLPLEEIIAEGSDRLVDLAKALLVAEAPMLPKVEYALVYMGDPARELLLSMLLEAVDADDDWRIRRICRPLARFAHPDTVGDVIERLDAVLADRLPKRPHLHALIIALGYLNDTRAVPRLVELLDDEDPSVRDEAAESLYNITGESFDFEADDPPDVRSGVLDQWRKWMRWHACPPA